MSEQDELPLPPEHRSLQPKRLRKRKRKGPGSCDIRDVNPERIYMALRKRANRRLPGVNSGFGQLEWILCPDGCNSPPPVARRDAIVAATVIQWLGTNARLCFIRNAERHIDDANRSADEKQRRPSIPQLEREEFARRAKRESQRGMKLRGQI